MHPILAHRPYLTIYLLVFLQAGILMAEVVRGAQGGERSLLWTLLLPLFGVHAFSCLASWYLCRSQPLGSTVPGRLLVAQGSSALLASGLLLGLGFWWARLLETFGLAAAGAMGASAALLLVFALFLYSLAVSLHYLFLALEASRAATSRAYELRLAAREAELRALRAQIDPHFLFNSLNSISALVTADPDGARAMCERLAGFLRQTLHLGDRKTIPLAQEVALAEAYLAVEGQRFGDRLAARIEVSPECEGLPVPPLVLQPLVENAVRHGIAHLLDGGEVTLRGEVSPGGWLHLVVDNPCDPDRPGNGGPGRRSGSGDGVGLANVRGRLEAVHGAGAAMRVTESDERYRVDLDIPIAAAGGPGGG
ncbi:MAG: histidine kinase [Acidobacteriota bacterium]